MRTIPKERVLRVNCPGHGHESFWNLGSARSLNNYSAIIVNPTSIAHLFDKDPELTRQVEQAMADGMTSYEIDDDMLLRNLSAEVESRIHELSDFLTQGGILVYFLCRPFVIEGPSLALDNYYWLESLAPDQPLERNVRHMSAVSHGRLIEPTSDGLQSEFGSYLTQHGLEWNTIIRTDFLTEGYHVLAEAGARKCIAGQLFIVESNGRVVFLPSPYSPDFDRVLIDGLNLWYQQKEPSEAELEAERREAAAKAAESAQQAPQIGPALFDREQGEPATVGALLAADLLSEPARAPAKTNTDTQTSIPAASSPFALNTAMNADEIVESVSQEARRFEEEVASKVTEAKRATGSIDLSIFAQTAKQLVEKAKEPEPQQAAAVTAPPAIPAPAVRHELLTPDPAPVPAAISAPPPAAAGIATSDAHPQLAPTPLVPPVFSAPAAQSAPLQTQAPPAQPAPHAPQAEPPAPPQPAEPPQFSHPGSSAVPPAASPAQPTPQPLNTPDGDSEVTSNNDASDHDNSSTVDLLRELEPPQHTPPPPPQPVHPPTASIAPAHPGEVAPPMPPKPLLNSLFKKDPAALPEAPPPVPQPVAHQQQPQAQLQQPPQAQRSPLGSLMQPTQAPNQVNDGQADKATAPSTVPGAFHMNNVPEWCTHFSFSYLDDLKREQGTLAGQLHDIQAKLNTVESRIASVDQLKCALLAGDPEVLRDACSTVLGRLGWSVSHSNTVESELLLSNVTKPESLARIVRSESHCNRSEVAQLAESAISFWDEHEVEPKGILVACTWSNVAPSGRNQQDFTDAVAEFARKKNLCLMTTLQLLGIYRDIELGVLAPDAIRLQMLETNGRLVGFSVESAALVAGRA